MLNEKYNAGRSAKHAIPKMIIESAYIARQTRIVTVVTLPEMPPECIMMYADAGWPPVAEGVMAEK